MTTAHTTAPTWLIDTYADVDGQDLDALLLRFAPEAELIFANSPAAVGRDAIRETLTQFWGTIGGLRHEFRALAETDRNGLAVEGTCHYRTHGGAQVPLPVVTMIDRDDHGLITSMRIYIDSAPLFAQIGAESSAQQ
ncbi:nuclear transport factor 2 family protein [Jongsikchunia kroppenstedtii]|uniref:nuclear transport factor 2 family protein n=1 Tax=Jongsikchunia kroppenstedtii TaxID=1121721 RepID=UPI000377ACB9|nr:nuclear transport factor 2 family protein [Jongsikchunia kroppenstedtii]